MFEAAKTKTVQKQMLGAVRVELMGLVKQGRLFITPILMEQEPFRSYAWYAIDGKSKEDTRIVDGLPPLRAPDVRLVCINTEANRAQLKTGRIRHKERTEERIIGTDLTREVARWVDAGTDATLPHDIARQVLQRDGWPIVDGASVGGRTGNVVEYEWLKAEAARPDAHQEVKDLLAKLDARLTPAADPKKTNRGAQATL